MSPLEHLSTPAAPAPLAHYSQAVIHDGIVYTAGAVGNDPESGRVVSHDIRDQTRQALANLSSVLIAAGSDLSRVIKVTCFLANPNDFAGFNETYAAVMPGTPPARTTVGIRFPDPDLLVEIELIAAVA